MRERERNVWSVKSRGYAMGSWRLSTGRRENGLLVPQCGEEGRGLLAPQRGREREFNTTETLFFTKRSKSNHVTIEAAAAI